MTRVRVESFSVSQDGFGAGPNQSIDQPLGTGGEQLHAWAMQTKTFHERVLGAQGGTEGIDDRFAQRGFDNIGAWILGRNMFTPSRGPWPDDDWKGWWGDNPPYRAPTFTLTHHERDPIEMEGGTTFYFVTGGINDALRLATEAAGAKDVRIGGGPNTIRQFLEASLIDEMHIAVAQVELGRGEPLWPGESALIPGYDCVENTQGELARHRIFKRREAAN